ncbi:DUF2490 domain-containing protein [Fibrella aquatilis]|uniref:DUF2490 domain-containing protein n=1 Tax=Fibrella aquatilis TaxID=2817059 RepID=A0A939G8G8_9BACT|nr:DUF2490 domain-containing protein [Fibrella aquatilis]MBO0932295.1 DUF2490 domain-containing protein [Fibrella aquatilis]
MTYAAYKTSRHWCLVAQCWLLLLALLSGGPLVAQNTRLTDRNTIGWLTNTTTLQFADRWSGHLEYQFRRDNFLQSPQQNLFRTGVNYRVSDRLTLRVGYAWVETFAYGNYPIQAAGRTFPEHRLYQMATLTNPVGRVDISHRFMLEQRWIGRFLTPESPRPDETVYVNRLRYMVRGQLPLSKVSSSAGGKTAYVAAYNEVFIGFGENVNENVFDQNRLGLLVGYRASPTFRVEGGFLQQLVQLPREINGRNVFQYNNGFILNTVVNLDLRRQ